MVKNHYEHRDTGYTYVMIGLLNNFVNLTSDKFSIVNIIVIIIVVYHCFIIVISINLP